MEDFVTDAWHRQLPQGALMLDSDCRISAASPELEALSGYPADVLRGMAVTALIPDVPAAPLGQHLVLSLIHRDGSRRPIQLWKTRFAGEAAAFLCVIGDRRQLRTDERGWLEAEAALSAIHSIPFALWISGLDGRCEVQNRVSRSRWGDLVGMLPEESALPEAAVREWADINRRALGGELVRHEWQYVDGGAAQMFENIVVPVLAGERIIGAVGLSVDITERKVAEARANYLATHDDLTDLPKRSTLDETISRLIAAGGRFCLCLLDLDRFRVINEALGHHAGDLLLKEIAKRLSQHLSFDQSAYHLGGDEFALLLPLAPEANPATLAQPLVGLISQALVISGTSVTSTCSMGVSVYPEDGETLVTLFKNADIAMSRAKRAGGNTLVCFSGEMHVDARARLALEADLRAAALAGQLTLCYEPKVSLADGRICGMEVLLRWQHPTLGAVPPSVFIPLAEESGLIELISEWVLETACRQNRVWLDSGYPPMRMAVNISARQFNRSLLQTLQRVLDESGHPPQLLDLEITESTLMLNQNEAVEIMHRLTALGVRLVVDDFGTGYSAFPYLRNFPVSSVKLDKTFISGVALHAQDQAIVRAIIALAHTLKLTVVAEYVEDEAQMETLRELSCDEYQGHFFSPPVTAEAFERLLGAQVGSDASA